VLQVSGKNLPEKFVKFEPTGGQWRTAEVVVDGAAEPDWRVFFKNEAEGAENTAYFRALEVRESGTPTPAAPAPPAAGPAKVPAGTELRRFAGNPEGARQVVLSPDGKTLLVCGRDGFARLFDVETGENRSFLGGHVGAVLCAAFSADGRKAVTGGADNTARVWDVAGGRELVKLAGLEGGVSAAAFTPDGKAVLTGGGDEVGRVWDAEGGQLLFKLKGHAGFVTAVACPADGATLLTASEDGTCRLWERATGKEVAVWPVGQPVNCLAAAPDGKALFAGTRAGSVCVYDLAARKELRRFDNPEKKEVLGLALSPDGRWLAAGDAGERLHVFAAATGKPAAVFEGHTGPVLSAAFTREGGRLASCSEDQTVRLWGLPDPPASR
jgi:WD40 repeat protein